jgi:undecaprenyl-diphosphatase
LLTFATVGYLVLADKRRIAMFVLVAVCGGLVLSALFKTTFDRPRPELVPHLSHVYSASFPSGHSMMSAITYLTLGTLLARIHKRRALKIYFLGLAMLLTFAVGISRVYLGVHWPTDVVAGWAAGASWAILCWLVALWLQQRRVVEPEAGEASAPAKA